MKYSDKGVENPVLLDGDLDENTLFTYKYIENNGLYYIKDLEEEEGIGTLFCNGNKIDDEVFLFKVDGYKVYYLKDFTKSNLSGTLMQFDGKNTIKIADDVTSFSIVDNYAAVLIDYNIIRKEGDLMLFPLNGKGKEKLIDEEVMFIKNGMGNSGIYD